VLAGWSVSSFYHNLSNRSKSDACLYELFCLESHILSFPKVLQIPPESPCMCLMLMKGMVSLRVTGVILLTMYNAIDVGSSILYIKGVWCHCMLREIYS
jgi:hypothetical protein